MNVELVVWRDSGFNINDGWEPVMSALSSFKFDDMLVTSAGLNVYEDDDILVLTTSWSETTKSAYGLQIIAKSNIEKREVYLHAPSQ